MTSLTRNDQGGPKYGLRDPDDHERQHGGNSEVVNHEPRDEADRKVEAVADFQLGQLPVLSHLLDEHGRIWNNPDNKRGIPLRWNCFSWRTLEVSALFLRHYRRRKTTCDWQKNSRPGASESGEGRKRALNNPPQRCGVCADVLLSHIREE